MNGKKKSKATKKPKTGSTKKQSIRKTKQRKLQDFVWQKESLKKDDDDDNHECTAVSWIVNDEETMRQIESLEKVVDVVHKMWGMVSCTLCGIPWQIRGGDRAIWIYLWQL